MNSSRVRRHSGVLQDSIRLIFRCTASPQFSTLSLHDALPISIRLGRPDVREAVHCPLLQRQAGEAEGAAAAAAARSEEHTSELQSRLHLVCRLLLEKKNFCKLLCRYIPINDFIRYKRHPDIDQ